MKIILEAQHACSIKPSGVSQYTVQMIRHLLERRAFDYELTFFDKDRERNNRLQIEKHFGEHNVPLHECNTLDYRTAVNDEKAFSEKSYNDYTGTYGDIYHFFHIITLPDNLVAKMVVTVHDVIPALYPELCHPNVIASFQLAKRRLEYMQPIVITDSLASKSDILSIINIPEERVYSIPLAYNKEECFPQKNTDILERLGITSPYILYLGAIDKRKNILRIIEAFESIAERISGIKLVIAGEGTPGSESIISHIHNSRYKSSILLIGYVSEKEKYALFSSAIAFVFPSLYEGFGLPVLEAMACGCPVITSNVSSLPEVAGEAAILVNPYDAKQLTYEMEEVVSTETLQEDMKKKGLEQSRKFSWEKAAEQTEGIYRLLEF